MNAAQPAIELLGFPGCPNTPAMRENLTAALAAIGKGWAFQDTNQEALPEDDPRRGYPTPTILVNGRDLFGLPVPTAPSMGCRLYPGGVPGGVGGGASLNPARFRLKPSWPMGSCAASAAKRSAEPTNRPFDGSASGWTRTRASAASGVDSCGSCSDRLIHQPRPP